MAKQASTTRSTGTERPEDDVVCVDLFCGAGGLTHGLISAGVKVRAGVDFEEACRHPYETNHEGIAFHQADVAELKGGEIRVFEVTPADAGLAPAKLSDLKGGDAKTNAAAITAVLAGVKGPFHDIVLLNAAAALIVGGLAANLTDGVALAAHSIESGAARNALERLVAVSNAFAG